MFSSTSLLVPSVIINIHVCPVPQTLPSGIYEMMMIWTVELSTGPASLAERETKTNERAFRVRESLWLCLQITYSTAVQEISDRYRLKEIMFVSLRFAVVLMFTVPSTSAVTFPLNSP